jgi:hypothetical protein
MPNLLSWVPPTVMAIGLSFCATAIRPTVHPPDAPSASLWVEPEDLEHGDLINGPWGAERAPNPRVRYRLVQRKHSGVNPGMTVRDPLGREWSVKQPGSEIPDEGPVEVTLSRVLSAVGYHQPPVYYLPSFTLEDDWGTHVEPGGRFRLKDEALKDRGEWSWQQNPFVGTTPYRGLLVILMLFNSSDLKNANNTLYEYRSRNGASTGTSCAISAVRSAAPAASRRERTMPTRSSVIPSSRASVAALSNFTIAAGTRSWCATTSRPKTSPGRVGFLTV